MSAEAPTPAKKRARPRRPTGKGQRRPGPKLFTQPARQAFLEHLAKTGRFYDSAAAAGVDYHTMLRYRAGNEAEDLEFELQVQKALEAYRDTLRREAHRRAVDGWVERGIFDARGMRVGEVVKYSDRLLELELKKHDHGYRERLEVEATGTVQHQHRHTVQLEELLRAATPLQRAKLREALTAFAPEQKVIEAEVVP